jgi:hypothetical protein
MELTLVSPEVGLHQTPPAIVSIQEEGENEFQASSEQMGAEEKTYFLHTSQRMRMTFRGRMSNPFEKTGFGKP